jgi:hypothetical protein
MPERVAGTARAHSSEQLGVGRQPLGFTMALSNSFFKRSLASAVAMASLTLVVANANATNLVNYSTSSWSGKSTSLGSFGAGYGADFTADFTNGALVGEASGNASIQIFGTTVSIVDLSASANINDASADGANLTVELVGATVYTESFDDGFTFDLSEDVSNYDDTFCTSFFDVSTTFTLVVVPITVSAGAEGCANLTFSATPQYNTSTHQGILNLDVTPGLAVDLTASAGVGSSNVSAGIEANVTLLDFSLPITLDPTYNFSTGAFTYGSTGQIDLSMLDGSVDLYAKVKFLFWSKKYTYTLFDWNGISKTWYLWQTGEPSAAGLSATIAVNTATGSYTFSDTAGLNEGASTRTWYRNSSPTDTGRTSVYSGTSSSYQSYTLTEADKGKYLQFCVTPKNSANSQGDLQCSDWEYVGNMALLYQNTSYGGTSLVIPFEAYDSATCFNLSSYSFNDTTSSYKLYAPTDSTATFVFYRDAGCSGESSLKTVAANGSNLQTTTADLGSTWDNQLSSMRIIYDEWVAAEDVSVSISGNTATAAYTFQVSEDAYSTDESGSTYTWYRALDQNGAGSTSIGSGVSHTLVDADDMKYLKVCVTPSNGYTTGSQACSDWTPVGHLIKFYDNTNYGGSSIFIAWEKSLKDVCFNMSDYAFDNKLTSYKWTNNTIASSTLRMYKDADCSGPAAPPQPVGAGGSSNHPNVAVSLGSMWDNSLSSFKISWSSSISISPPQLSIYGNVATESHNYSDTIGLAESATYTWYRASDSSGTGSTEIDMFNADSYTLTGDDNTKFLKVCVLSSNGVMVDEVEMCSPWVAVGPLVQLYANPNQGGNNLHIAYMHTTSGACFNLPGFSFNDLASSMRASGLGSGTAVLHTYQHVGCNDTGTTQHTLAPGSNITYNFMGTVDNNRSSFKVVY